MADNDEKIKRALKAKINASDEIFVDHGDLVFFKEVDKQEWSGPPKGVGSEGKTIFLIYGNNLRRVHASRVILSGNEYNKPSNGEKHTEDDGHEIAEAMNEKFIPTEYPSRRRV